MNTVYHLPANSYDEYKRKLQDMLNNEDAALCCATVLWQPTGKEVCATECQMDEEREAV